MKSALALGQESPENGGREQKELSFFMRRRGSKNDGRRKWKPRVPRELERRRTRQKTTSPLSLWITIENHLAGGRGWMIGL